MGRGQLIAGDSGGNKTNLPHIDVKTTQRMAIINGPAIQTSLLLNQSFISMSAL